MIKTLQCLWFVTLSSQVSSAAPWASGRQRRCQYPGGKISLYQTCESTHPPTLLCAIKTVIHKNLGSPDSTHPHLGQLHQIKPVILLRASLIQRASVFSTDCRSQSAVICYIVLELINLRTRRVATMTGSPQVGTWLGHLASITGHNLIQTAT